MIRAFFPVMAAALLFCSTAPVPPLHAQASSSSAEARLQQGIRELQFQSVPTALSRWFAHSPLGNDDKGLALVSAELEKTLASYGSIEGSAILGDRELGTHVQRFYFILNCQRGPIYCSADAFLSTRGWILTDFQFHTKAAKVLPDTLLEP